MTDQELHSYAARFQYFRYLKAGLAEWLVTDETERKKLDKINKSIDKYLEYLGDIITEALEKKG